MESGSEIPGDRGVCGVSPTRSVKNKISGQR